MRRGLLMSVSLGLLGALIGCSHRSQGVCDCPVQPIDHLTPSPVVKPALPAGASDHPLPAANTPAPPVAP